MDKGNQLIASNLRFSAKFSGVLSLILLLAFVYSLIAIAPYDTGSYSNYIQVTNYKFLMDYKWLYLIGFAVFFILTIYSFKKAYFYTYLKEEKLMSQTLSDKKAQQEIKKISSNAFTEFNLKKDLIENYQNSISQDLIDKKEFIADAVIYSEFCWDQGVLPDYNLTSLMRKNGNNYEADDIYLRQTIGCVGCNSDDADKDPVEIFKSQTSFNNRTIAAVRLSELLSELKMVSNSKSIISNDDINVLIEKYKMLDVWKA